MYTYENVYVYAVKLLGIQEGSYKMLLLGANTTGNSLMEFLFYVLIGYL